MQNKLSVIVLACGLALGSMAAARAAENTADRWYFDGTIYGFAPAMSGDIAVRGKTADLDIGFDDIWRNLDSAFMGRTRIGYGRWAFNTDLIYMGLKAGGTFVTIEMEQWMVQPTLSYRISPKLEVLAGVRYNQLNTTIKGPFGVSPSGMKDWWDPIVGGIVSLPVTDTLSANFYGDIGGFDVGSKLSWQAFPYLGWQFAEWGSLQAGYRWLYMDYEDGEGNRLFRYDVTTQGPQVGVTGHF